MPTSGDKFRLKQDHYSMILDYFEVPENWIAITGGSSRPKINGKCQSKGTLFKQMIVVLHAAGFPKAVDGNNLQKRWNRYLAKYKEAREIKCGSDRGLSDEEAAAGLTLEDKLNKICPCFDRIHALHRGRHNVDPPADGEFGVDYDIVGYTTDPDEEGAEPVTPMAPAQSSCPPHTPTVILSEESPEVMGDSSFLRNEMPLWANLEEIARDNIAQEHEDGEATQQYGGSEFHNQHTEDVPPQESEAEIGDPPMNVGTQRSRVKPKKGVAQDLPQLRKQQRAKENHVPNGQPPQNWPNMAQIYAERLNLKANYRKELTMKRDKWKALELDDRQMARSENRMEGAIAHERLRKHAIEMENKAAAIARKKTKAEHDFHLQKIRAEQKTQLLIELFKNPKPTKEMKQLIDLVDFVNSEE